MKLLMLPLQCPLPSGRRWMDQEKKVLHPDVSKDIHEERCQILAAQFSASKIFKWHARHTIRFILDFLVSTLCV